MQPLAPEHWVEWVPLLPAERVGGLTAHHCVRTGVGRWWVDRWPEPRAAVQFGGGMMDFWGDPARVPSAALDALLDELLETWDRVLIHPRAGFARFLEARPQGLRRWPRVQYQLGRRVPLPAAIPGVTIAALGARDLAALSELSEEIRWIEDPWGGMERLAGSRFAFGAFEAGTLVSVAAVSALGSQLAELAVVTEPAARGLGLSTACAAMAAAAVIASGRRVGWSTSVANTASRAVAEKLGFREVERDELWWEGASPLHVDPVSD